MSSTEYRTALDELAEQVVDENGHMVEGATSDERKERHAHLDALTHEVMRTANYSPSFSGAKKAVMREVRGRENLSQCCGAPVRTAFYATLVCSRCRAEV